ncbi:phage holin family protein [Euzebya sp.]|uniref:phage holin family protein n=1 Tax=Euzebya sp. TaxID=1971409 RepID=UPI0035131901
MSTTDPTGERPPPLARLVGRRPTQGAVPAAKTVISDVQALVRAEVDLAKAELADGIKAKAIGSGLFIAVAIIGWLAVQVLLVFIGFLFALFLPGWAAVGMVLLLLLVVAGVLGWLGMKKMKVPASLDTTKQSVAQSQEAAKTAVDQAKANTEAGIEQAKQAVAESAQDVRQRFEEWRGAAPPPTMAPPAATSPTTAPPTTTPPATAPQATTPAPLSTPGTAEETRP